MTTLTPKQLIEYMNYYDRSIIRIVSKELQNFDIFEAVAHREITPEQGAELLILKRESNYWIVRFLRDLWYMLFY